MTDYESIQQQIREYESQLSDVNELLTLTPDDDSLRSLQADLLELVRITQQSLPPAPQPSNGNNVSGESVEGNPKGSYSSSLNGLEKALEAAVENSVRYEINQQQEPLSNKRMLQDETAADSFANILTEAAAAAADRNDSNQLDEQGLKKKLKQTKEWMTKEFTIPSHLIPNDGDSEAERNRKRRAVKALKSKWREKKKELESDHKQQSWQSFQKKTSKRRNDQSIFSTTNHDNDPAASTATKVGVVSGGRTMTEFGERKRHNK